jgi:ribosomal protein S18 acetylase RimI-like enzyme
MAANEPGSPAILITPIDRSELGEAVGVLTRGMLDNPLHVAAFGEDAVARQRRLLRLFAAAASILDWNQTMLAARDTAGHIVGVCGYSLPGHCQPTTMQRLRMLPATIGLGLRPASRVLQWMDAWAHHDLAEPHWHLGPVAVDAGLQGRGIGLQLLAEFCTRADAATATAWLETAKAVNVRFYQRFGFETVGEEPVLGTTSWYMIRNRHSNTELHMPST